MKIPDEARKCVAFILCKYGEDFHPKGTAFFIGVPIPGTDSRAVYAVTARHVIEGISKEAVDDRVYLRMNFLDSGAKLIHTNVRDWYFHPVDDTVDVAVMSIRFRTGADHLACPIEMFVDEKVIWEQNIGLGEEVFSVGLFVLHTGNKRNIPIIRAGHIAAMPQERVSTKWKKETGIEGYLIETRSHEGLSGCPVFVHLHIKMTQSGEFPGAPQEVFYLLGLMHGHWNSRVSTIDMVVLGEKYNELVNAGVSIVVPAVKIKEIIEPSRIENNNKRLLEREA